jgi:hypothetical protein
VAIPSLLLILLFPAAAAKYLAAYNIAGLWQDGVAVSISSNLLIFPIEIFDAQFRLVPASWSVAIEIMNYALLWACVARGAWRAFGALIIGAAYHIVCWFTVPEEALFRAIYFTPYAAVLPFSCGALIYFARPYLPQSVSLLATLTLVVMWTGVMLLSHVGYFITSFYIGLVLAVAAVGALAGTKTSPIDAAIGEYSYPIFLTHFIAGFAVYLATGYTRGLMLFLLGMPIIWLASWLLIRFNAAYVSPARDAVRRASLRAHPPNLLAAGRLV